MKKNCLLLALSTFGAVLYGQVGINIPSPTATLDITAKISTGKATSIDGLLVPRVDRDRAQNMGTLAIPIPVSTLIYVNNITTGTQDGNALNIDTVGYYYFDESKVWTKLKTPAGGSATTQFYDWLKSGGAQPTAVGDNSANIYHIGGNVGIGTSAPQGILNIVSNNTGGGAENDVYFDGYGASKYPSIFLGSAGGSLSAPTGLTNGDKIGGYYFKPLMNGGAWVYTSSGISSNYKGNGDNNLTDLRFNTSSAERATIDENGNMGIGTLAPNSNALLEVSSTTKGFLPPRMTTAQRDAITPKPEGLVIYNLDIHCLQYWNATEWTGNCNNGGAASVVSLSCGSAVFSPSTMTSGTAYSGTMTVPYTGGNGSSYAVGSAIASTGVTGLTATLQSGTLANGSGNLTYTISGTPSTSGTASFNVSFNGATSCTVAKTVTASTPTNPVLTSCATQYGSADFPGTFTIGSNPVNISVANSSGAVVGPQNTYCGVGATTTNGWYVGNNGGSTTTFTFDRPVSNIQFITAAFDSGEVLTITAKNGTTSVSPSITLFQNCTTIVTSGNQISKPGNFLGTAGAFFNLGGTFYTSVTIEHNGLGGGAALTTQLCNAISQ